MEKEKVQTSQGLEELARETEAEINQLTEEIEQEPKAIPGGSARKVKRRGLTDCEKITCPECKNMKKPKKYLLGAIVIPKRTMTLPLCV